MNKQSAEASQVCPIIASNCTPPPARGRAVHWAGGAEESYIAPTRTKIGTPIFFVNMIEAKTTPDRFVLHWTTANITILIMFTFKFA